MKWVILFRCNLCKALYVVDTVQCDYKFRGYEGETAKRVLKDYTDLKASTGWHGCLVKIPDGLVVGIAEVVGIMPEEEWMRQREEERQMGIAFGQALARSG